MPTFYRDYEGVILQAETRRNRLHLLGSYTYSESEGNTANGAAQTYATALADFFPVHFYNREGYLPDHREHRVKLNGYYLFPHNWTVGFDGFFSSAGHQTIFSTCAALAGAGAANARRSIVDQTADFDIDTDLVQYCSTSDGAALGTTDIFLHPRGSFETKSTWQLDIQASKTWNVKSVDITVVGTIYNLFDRELDLTFNSEAYLETGEEYQNVDPNEPYYDEYYGEDSSPVLRDIGEPLSYRLPRRYEVGFRIEF